MADGARYAKNDREKSRRGHVTAISSSYDLISELKILRDIDQNTVTGLSGSGSVVRLAGSKSATESDGLKHGDSEIRDFQRRVKISMAMLIDEARGMIRERKNEEPYQSLE